MNVAKTLRSVSLDTANAEQKETLEAAQKQVGFIPTMYANMVDDKFAAYKVA